MSTSFSVDLLFRSKGQGELQKFAQGAGKVDTAVKKAQGSTDKLGKALGGVGAKAGQAANGISKTGRAAAGASKGVNKLTGAIKGVIGAYALVSATKFVFFKTAELETQTRSLKVLTGSMETAKSVVKELQDFGNVTPFTSTELIETAKRLKAFGVDTDKLVDTTKRLGDVAGATGAKLDGVATAYGQIQAKGRLQGEELLQLQERGINLQDELQKMYGLTGDEFRKALEKGQFSAEAVEVALTNLTNTGGKYANGAIAQSDTLNGRLSTLQDNIGRLAQNIGKQLSPVFTWVINKSIETLNYINRLFNQANKIQGYGVDNKTRDRLFKQATDEAKEIALLRGGGKLDPAVFNQVKQERFSDLLENYGINKGVVEVEIKPVIDNSGPKIPELLGQTGTGTGAGTSSRQAAASKQLMGKVVELLTGDKSSQFYRADHGGSNYHVHVAFENQEQKELAKALLQSKGIQIGSENDGRHAPGSYHYSNQAFDVPMSQVPVGQEDAFSQKIFGILGKEFGGLLGGTGGGGGTDVIGQLVADARVEMDRLRESALSTWQSMQEGILGTNTNLEQQVTDLNEVNRLIMEGMSPELAETQVANQRALLDIDAERISKLSELNKLQGLSADELKSKEEAINAAFDKRLSLQGQLNEGREVSTQLAEQQAQAEELKQQVSGLAGGIASEFTNAFRGVITGTKDVQTAFSEMLQGIADRFLDFAMSILQDAITQQLVSLFSSLLSGPGASAGGGGFLGGGGNGLGQLFGDYSGFGGMFADGGRPEPNKVSIIGENGPELFVPDSAGTVIPNDAFEAARNAMGGSTTPSEAFADNTSSIATTNSYMREREYESNSQTTVGSGGSMVIETQVINNVEYATVEQVAVASAASAKQARAQVFSDMKNKPSRRAMVGLR